MSFTLHDVHEAVIRARRDVLEIVDLCALAGRRELAASFVLDGATPHSVKRTLTRLTTTADPSAHAGPTRQEPAAAQDDQLFKRMSFLPLANSGFDSEAIRRELQKQH